MAEILQQQHKQKAGVRKTKKVSLRVDLTPMVDLGFLLIAFFVFTTTLAHPTAMVLKLPDDKSVDSSQAPESKTLNLILGANNNVFSYEGNNINKIKNIGSKVSALREIIIQKKAFIRNEFGSDSGMIVLIKPTKNATYANVVNALDEMQVNMIKTYVLMDANETESDKIKSAISLK